MDGQMTTTDISSADLQAMIDAAQDRTHPRYQRSMLRLEVNCASLAAEVINLRAANMALVAGQAKLDTIEGAAAVLSKNIPNPIFDALKPILIGEYTEAYTTIDEDGDEVDASVIVSWTTTKKIIGDAIAALSPRGQDHAG